MQRFHDWGPYHIEVRPLICSANQWTGFYMTEAFVMKELMTILRGFYVPQNQELHGIPQFLDPGHWTLDAWL